jgi:hypothetical protein
MSGAWLSVPAAALALSLAAANPDGVALTQLGLAGNWAVDCSQAISDANPNVTFDTAGDQAPQYIERGPNGAAGDAALSNVHSLANGQVAITFTIVNNMGGQSAKIVMNNVLIKDGNRFRFLEAKSGDGQETISGGVQKSNGQQTKWLQKCGG